MWDVSNLIYETKEKVTVLRGNAMSFQKKRTNCFPIPDDGRIWLDEMYQVLPVDLNLRPHKLRARGVSTLQLCFYSTVYSYEQYELLGFGISY